MSVTHYETSVGRLRRLFCCAIAAGVTLAGLAVTTLPANADSSTTQTTVLPPTLAGETFSQTSNDVSFFSCTGGSFTSSGVASGPYPGPYTEAGDFTTSAVYRPPGVASGTVTSFHSTFTITTADGATVSGTKTLDLTAPQDQATVGCSTYLTARFSDAAPLTYNAQTRTPSGTYKDTGRAFATFSGHSQPYFPATPYVATFTENFAMSNGLLPTDQSQCENGGWSLFPPFTNQGDCVSFIATGGRNRPGK